MDITLKPIDQQVIVITGASSGIGLATARLAASRGAVLVLGARSVLAMQQIVQALNDSGHPTSFVPCDVSIRSEVEQLAAEAIRRFGRIDTWVNNAGLSIYGRLDEIEEQDARRLFDINFWGVYNGSLVALQSLRLHGGALINVGSEVSEAIVPLQGIYSASKHAVKGFTDALRVEIQEIDESPVSITLIQPTAVDTPFPQHARNYMVKEPKLPSPQIEPDDVAEAILDAAVSVTREKKVGAGAVLNTMAAKFVPGLADKISAQQADRQQYQERPRNPEGTLYEASEIASVAGQTHGTGGRE